MSEQTNWPYSVKIETHKDYTTVTVHTWGNDLLVTSDQAQHLLEDVQDGLRKKGYVVAPIEKEN